MRIGVLIDWLRSRAASFVLCSTSFVGDHTALQQRSKLVKQRVKRRSERNLRSQAIQWHFRTHSLYERSEYLTLRVIKRYIDGLFGRGRNAVATYLECRSTISVYKRATQSHSVHTVTSLRTNGVPAALSDTWRRCSGEPTLYGDTTYQTRVWVSKDIMVALDNNLIMSVLFQYNIR